MHRHTTGQTSKAGKWGGLIALGAAMVILGAWSVHAAELRPPKKTAPSEAASDRPPVRPSPTLKNPQVTTTPERTLPGSRRSGKGTSTSTSTTREPLPGEDESEEPEISPCNKPNLKLDTRGMSRRSRPCPEESEASEESEEDETDADSGGDSDEDTDLNEDPESASGGDGDEDPEGSSDEAGQPPDYDELTGKVPGFTPFGGEESGSSESSTVEGGRPWYEKLGKPGGGRPPADDDDDE